MQNWRGRLGVVIAAVAAGLVVFAAFAPGGERPGPLPPPGPAPAQRPLLVALGDSVAAGYGAGGLPAAYPARVGARTGRLVRNLAEPGATSEDVLDDQLGRILAPPDLVTITVGANDIRFAECFAALFGLGDDPCAGADFEANLDALSTNLGTVLDRLGDRYPRARVYVSEYYDPLPARDDGLCGIDAATYSGGGTGDRTVRRIARRLLDERLHDFEQRLYEQATERLRRLNRTIESVAAAKGARVVAVDFEGHDLCATNAWVFAPDVIARLNFKWAGPDYAETLTYRAPIRCVAPCGPVVPFTTRIDATVGTLVVNGRLLPNGTPHPNPQGQIAIADAFTAAINR
jgi:lysophospholipase L1-like esterase